MESLVEKVHTPPRDNTMSGRSNGHNQPNAPLCRSIREFLKLKPPVFTGASETEDPLLFLDGIKKALDALECSSTRSAEFAAHRLQDIAEEWFKSFKAGRSINSHPLTWTEFSDAFTDRFLPMSRRDALLIQFEGLRQTPEMSVNEYDILFTRLSRYAAYTMTDSTRAKRFIRGLIDPLFKALASHLTKGDITYSEAVDVAKEVEGRWREGKATEAQNKRTRTTGSFDGSNSARRGPGYQNHLRTTGSFDGSNSTRRGPGYQNHLRATEAGGASISQSSNGASTSRQSNRGPIPFTRQANRTTATCPSCHKAHTGQCWREIGACLRCGEMGHYKRDCPRFLEGSNPASTSRAPTNSTTYPTKDNSVPINRGAGNKSTNGRGSNEVGRGQSRVFALTRQDAEASNAVVTDNLNEGDHLTWQGDK